MNRRHRSIKMSPNQAEQEDNQDELFHLHQIKYGKVKRQKPKYKVGDTVRVALERDRNKRGWHPNFSDDVFTIREIKTNLPVVRYVLTDPQDGEPITGNWFQDELTEAST